MVQRLVASARFVLPPSPHPPHVWLFYYVRCIGWWQGKRTSEPVYRPCRGTLSSRFNIGDHKHNEWHGRQSVSSHIEWLHRCTCSASPGPPTQMLCSDDIRGCAQCTWLKGCCPVRASRQLPIPRVSHCRLLLPAVVVGQQHSSSVCPCVSVAARLLRPACRSARVKNDNSARRRRLVAN